MLDQNLPDEPPPEWQQRNREIAQERASRELEERQRAEAEAVARREATVAAAGIPARVLLACQTHVETPAILAMREKANRSTIVLSGNTGVGKSVAAALWLLGHREALLWVTAGSLARGYAYDEAIFRQISRATALVVDDLGEEYMDERGRYLCTFEEIMKARHDNMLPTCLTTNITDKRQFAARYQARLSSRLCEDGAWIECKGTDLRRQHKAA